MQPFPLKPEELRTLLRYNDFSYTELIGSHERWEGFVDNEHRTVSLDTTKTLFTPLIRSDPLYFIAIVQLRLRRPGSTEMDAWERFYAGEPTTAQRAEVAFCKWN